MIKNFIFQPFTKLFRRFNRLKNKDLFIILFLATDLLVGALLVQHFENAAIENVQEHVGLWDCIWLALTTATTVGYGDLSASSLGGRIVSIIFFYMGGIGVAAYLLGRMVEVGLDFRINRRRGLVKVDLESHIILCNFPSARTIEQIVAELRADPRGRERPIVIVTDSIEELPFALEDVHFVRGSPIEEEPLKRANVAEAWMSIALAEDLDDSHADAIVSAIVIMIKSMNENCTCVAECADRSKQKLLKQCGADRIVYAGNLTSNLIVQEAIDPGVSGLIESFSSNRDGAQFYSELVSSSETTVEQCQSALRALDSRAHVLAVYRESEEDTYIALPEPSMKLRNGDHVVYVARNRLDWQEVSASLGTG
ncbi:MAG: ion channel [Planctomycetota bacterium]|nr:ion channel [Planctomycetota bacterium]MDP7248693.1 ion channel [Planctomycetota bacterium]